MSERTIASTEEHAIKELIKSLKIFPTISKIAKESGISIYPSAESLIKNYMIKSISNKTICNVQDIFLSCAAIILSSAEQAKKKAIGPKYQ